MKNVFIDFETYSPVDISLGPRAYTAHREFKPLRVSYAVDNGPVKSTRNFPALLAALPETKFQFIAHNAPFDRAVFERVYGVHDIAWDDTAAVCRYLSVPASLDGASEFFALGRKKEAGKGLIKKLNAGLELSPEEWKEFEAYGKQDVELCRKLYKLFQSFDVSLDPFAARIHALHLDMNAQGIKVDQKRTARLLDVVLSIKNTAKEKAAAKFGTYKKGRESAPVASSADQVKAYLKRAGHPVDSIAEKDLEGFLALAGAKLPKNALELIAFFREIQSRGADKLQIIASNGLTRIYDSSLFHGTHTGRPAGGGINLLNVKRAGHGDDEKPFEKALARILKEAVPGEKVKRLSSLLWGCLIPDRAGHVIVRSDLSAIEPRVGAWLRSDSQIMNIYALADSGQGKDEYTIFGESMRFPKAILRNLSKVVILAACYGMSAERLRAQCRSWGMPDPEHEAKKILDGYHSRNPSVRRAWFDLIKAAVKAIETGVPSTVCKVLFYRETIGGVDFLRLKLPSGRIKSYADVQIERRGSNGWKTFSYINPKRKFRETVPAAGLYENIVQSVAVDVSFQKAFEIKKTPGLIIHDELNFSTLPRQALSIEKRMRAPVSWLPGMPVKAKTHCCTSYHKGDSVK